MVTRGRAAGRGLGQETWTPPASTANAAALGEQANGSVKAAGFPRLELVTLVACGTRALLGAACGPLAGPGAGKRDLARQLLGSLRRGRVLLADGGLYSYALWGATASTGAAPAVARQGRPAPARGPGTARRVLPHPRQ